ncbi:hypothetical protein NM688_g3382 [Phlebia brevispora]|uniref:Uncharacterized protein n=1 Tax=Phlebia brevispora TaxID=194682 RepID=A0ACC1T5V1_9APHY|nr:hypothetical protein NM688_g3382 [Phlebia brevispora]
MKIHRVERVGSSPPSRVRIADMVHPTLQNLSDEHDGTVSELPEYIGLRQYIRALRYRLLHKFSSRAHWIRVAEGVENPHFTYEQERYLQLQLSGELAVSSYFDYSLPVEPHRLRPVQYIHLIRHLLDEGPFRDSIHWHQVATGNRSAHPTSPHPETDIHIARLVVQEGGGEDLTERDLGLITGDVLVGYRRV